MLYQTEISLRLNSILEGNFYLKMFYQNSVKLRDFNVCPVNDKNSKNNTTKCNLDSLRKSFCLVFQREYEICGRQFDSRRSLLLRKLGLEILVIKSFFCLSDEC